jgi:hypothetical protein
MALSSGTRDWERIEPFHASAGGTGGIYRAQDARPDRELAIKVLLSHVAGNRQGSGRPNGVERLIVSKNFRPGDLLRHGWDFGAVFIKPDQLHGSAAFH